MHGRHTFLAGAFERSAFYRKNIIASKIKVNFILKMSEDEYFMQRKG